MLETTFQAWDEIAQRRRVFKVETGKILSCTCCERLHCSSTRRHSFRLHSNIPVGDCYVAVVGVPTARKDHAVVAARFARDIMRRFDFLSKGLVQELGPGKGYLRAPWLLPLDPLTVLSVSFTDTEDLDVRIGIHSGSVTAGVLRGERARFQLFGDAMNVASRIESTGQPGKIHLSQKTADLLVARGKSHWLRSRADKVHAKGKGIVVRLRCYHQLK